MQIYIKYIKITSIILIIYKKNEIVRIIIMITCEYKIHFSQYLILTNVF